MERLVLMRSAAERVSAVFKPVGRIFHCALWGFRRPEFEQDEVPSGVMDYSRRAVTMFALAAGLIVRQNQQERD